MKEFECPEVMRTHCESVLQGEYDVGLEGKFEILDVGANCGAFTVFASKRWPGSTIHAYEPIRGNFEHLVRNAAKLIGPITPVRLNNLAVTATEKAEMFLGANNPGECSFYNIGEQSSQTEAVSTVRPSSLPHAHILKLDTEGCEVEILQALADLGREFLVVLLEYHGEFDRIKIDKILSPNYALCGGAVTGIGRGTFKYVSKRVLRQTGINQSFY